eukprot:907101_1
MIQDDKMLQTHKKEELDLSGKIWQQVDRTLSHPKYHNIRILTVNNSALATIPLLPHGIEVLDLSRNHIDRMQGLNALSHLQSLRLSHNEIRRIEGISKNYQLQELFISHNNIREIENIQHLQALHTIDIRFNHLSHIDLLKRLEVNSNLREVYVDGNEFAIRRPNFQKFVFQILTSLQIVDGMTNTNSYFKQKKQRKTLKRRNCGNDHASVSSITSSNKPRYMSSTISIKLKAGGLDEKSSARARKIKCTSRKLPKNNTQRDRKNKRNSYQLQYQNRANFNSNPSKHQPVSWTNFNHYSMKPKASKVDTNKPSIYNYSTPKKNMTTVHIPSNPKPVADTMVSPVSSLPTPDCDSNSSIPAIPININNNNANKHDIASSLNNFDTDNNTKTRMKDVIKKLNEKINKLYSWHLVEIDLVSKQQMQLNEIRTELTSTRQSLSTYQFGHHSMAATPLRLLATPQSGTAASLDLSEAKTDHLSSMSTRSAFQLNNPDFLINTLQKCYQILKRDNATTSELDAVENLVQQVESDMAANAQLEDLKKKQLEKASKSATKSQQSSQSPDIVSDPNSMVKQFNAYNEEIEKLEKELTMIDISAQSSETLPSLNQSTSEIAIEKEKSVTNEINETPSESQDIDTENDPNDVTCTRTQNTLNDQDTKDINEWLSELADELNTANLSLRHLMDISQADVENRTAKVKEFNIVASKCDMFSSFEAPANINMIIENNISLNTKIGIQNCLHQLQMTKDSIQNLILYIIQNKPENEIQKQRDKIIQRNLVGKEQYKLSMEHMGSSSQFI